MNTNVSEPKKGQMYPVYNPRAFARGKVYCQIAHLGRSDGMLQEMRTGHEILFYFMRRRIANVSEFALYRFYAPRMKDIGDKEGKGSALFDCEIVPNGHGMCVELRYCDDQSGNPTHQLSTKGYRLGERSMYPAGRMEHIGFLFEPLAELGLPPKKKGKRVLSPL